MAEMSHNSALTQAPIGHAGAKNGLSGQHGVKAPNARQGAYLKPEGISVVALNEPSDEALRAFAALEARLICDYYIGGDEDEEPAPASPE